MIVELGTYWGTSFFSFCQSVLDNGLSTTCVAIDTWEGDKHTGGYQEDVFSTVQERCKKHFPGLSVKLLKMYFEEALSHFDEKSIDILHIDGLHTYEAVSEDYHSWLPKLADDGIVLFHDIAEDSGYGSVLFWRELSSQYPSFEFQHSWGLGVLFPKGDKVYQRMLNNNLEDKLLYYTSASELLLSQLRVEDLSRIGEARHQRIEELEGLMLQLEDDHRHSLEELKKIKNSKAFKWLTSIKIIGS